VKAPPLAGVGSGLSHVLGTVGSTLGSIGSKLGAVGSKLGATLGAVGSKLHIGAGTSSGSGGAQPPASSLQGLLKYLLGK
jgi:hypothetical protein